MLAELLRPHLAPFLRSIAVPCGRLLPSRSFGLERAEWDRAKDVTEWTPWGTKLPNGGPRMSSGPGAGALTRPGVATAFLTPPGLWNLSGVATGWSRPLQATPGRQPTTQLAMGRWSPIAGNPAPPLPGLPEPARMVTPQIVSSP